MSGERFVEALKIVMRNSAAHAVLKTLEAPAGARPSPRLVELSKSYHALDHSTKEFIADVVRETAHVALFGLCAVLDHSRVFDDPPHARLELYCVRDDERTLINDPKQEQLMDFVGIDPAR
jgi:hypothetical protein